jgi:acetyl esterase/lipase
VIDLQSLCRQLDSVEYSLSPEATYRASIEDNYAALRWRHANAAKLGVNPAWIAMMGESAGGGDAGRK